MLGGHYCDSGLPFKFTVSAFFCSLPISNDGFSAFLKLSRFITCVCFVSVIFFNLGPLFTLVITLSAWLSSTFSASELFGWCSFSICVSLPNMGTFFLCSNNKGRLLCLMDCRVRFTSTHWWNLTAFAQCMCNSFPVLVCLYLVVYEIPAMCCLCGDYSSRFLSFAVKGPHLCQMYGTQLLFEISWRLRWPLIHHKLISFAWDVCQGDAIMQGAIY